MLYKLRGYMKEFLIKNTVPVLLNTVVVSGMAYIYTYGDGWLILLFTLFAFILSAALFVLFEFLRKKNKIWLNTIVVSSVYILALVVSNRLMNNDAMLWFMEPARFTVVYTNNISALVILAGTVLGASMYYFTRIKYRRLLVFLICICTFALFAKTFTDIPVIYTILITTLYFLLMIDNNSGEGLLRNRSFYISTVFFMVVVTVIASFSPKIEFAPYREEFDELITGINIGGNGQQNFNDFTDSSANTTPDNNSEVIFYIYGDNPKYIKRQCFDFYSKDEQVWRYGFDNLDGYNNWESYIAFENPSDLMSAAGYESEAGTEKKTSVFVLPDGSVVPIKPIYTTENIADIKSDSGRFSYRDIFRNNSGEFNFSDYTGTYSYTLEWYDVAVDTSFAALFTDSAAERYSENEAVSSYIRAKREAEKYGFISYFDTSFNYGSADSYEKVKALISEVTTGAVSDYAKAEAICNYLKDGDYRYDKNFRSIDPSIENFILNTKRGVCYNFATAMTLMCREAGLKTRYVEGFLVQNYNKEKEAWEVRSTDAHAYVQVWIDGYGWTDFDPTANIIEDSGFDKTFIIVGIAVIIFGAVTALMIILRPVIEEKRYAKRVRTARGGKQAVLIYEKICALVLERTGEKKNTYTPEEIAEKSNTLFGYDISGFIDEYRSSVYGNIPSEADNSNIYYEIKKAYKNSKK